MTPTSTLIGDQRPMLVHWDERGRLFELFRADDVLHRIRMAYCVTIEPGHARDMRQWHVHWHKNEWFTPIVGVGRIARMNTMNEVWIHNLDGDKPAVVHVAPFERHSVINDGDVPLVLVVLVDWLYDGSDERREEMKGDGVWADYPAE